MTRKQAAIATPEGHLQALAAYIDQGLAISRDGRICWASSGFARGIGPFEDPSEIVGRTLDSLIQEAGEELPIEREAAERIRRVRNATSCREIELAELALDSARTGDGAREELWVLREAMPIGELETEQHSLSQALVAAKRELAEVRESFRRELSERDQLLGVVAHELRTPVTVIRGYNNLLLSDQVGSLNDQQRSFVEQSNRSCQRLNLFIGDLAKAGSDARGSLSLTVETGSVEPLIAGVVAFLRPLLKERELVVDVELDRTALWAKLDPSRIEQVLTNLLSNAIRYSKPQSRIRVCSRPLEAEGRHFVELSVVDSGPGVAYEDRSRIFEPYVQAGDGARSGGLGLGLAICKRIVAAHGGDISVCDEPEWGSRFTFTLEAAVPAERD